MIINYTCETFIVEDTGWQQRVQRVEEEKQQNMNNIMTDLSKQEKRGEMDRHRGPIL
jgi:hypothetical protein